MEKIFDFLYKIGLRGKAESVFFVIFALALIIGGIASLPSIKPFSTALAYALYDDVLPAYTNFIRQILPPEPEPEPEPMPIPEPALPEPAQLPAGSINVTYENIEALDYATAKKNLYTVDQTAYVSQDDLNFSELLNIDTHADLTGSKPKVLIFHTHSQEDFIDSRDGVEADTIVGVGDVLAEILTKDYGISVLHHKGIYDREDGKEARGGSYEKMEPDIQRVLDENPSIEIVIDLHRDAVPADRHLVTVVDGKATAQLMFFNGVCQKNDGGTPASVGLVNEYLKDNLAFSLRMKLLANEMFPGFTRKNYIKPYRYSLHMRPLSLLVEAGANTNTVDEVKNAMIPLAEILVKAVS